MSERTVLVIANNNWFIGKLDGNNKVVTGLAMCSFVNIQTRDGAAQVIALRKLGRMDVRTPEHGYLLIDLESDSDLYREYVKLTTGIAVAQSRPVQ